jgi:DNA processing protein
LVLLGMAALTPRRLLLLAWEEGTASACLAAVRGGRAGSDGDRAHAERTDPASVAERLRDRGGRLVAVGDEEYPPALLNLFDPPAGLFVLGNDLRATETNVAVVGARNCSPTGRDVAYSLGRSLALADASVVSGGARGIDAAAHEGALRAGGSTIAVLGSGIDVTYPPQNRTLLAEVAGSGSLVSEYPPGTRAEPFRFPARNRIVAGLSQAVVVVEGAAGSGSMITADHALEIGREVFAVPGPVTSPLSASPHRLIREGATLIRDGDDLLSDLGLTHPTEDTEGEEPIPKGLTPAQRSVWRALIGATPVDVIAAEAGLPVAEVVPALVGLELLGLIRQVGGRYERRVR